MDKTYLVIGFLMVGHSVQESTLSQLPSQDGIYTSLVSKDSITGKASNLYENTPHKFSGSVLTNRSSEHF